MKRFPIVLAIVALLGARTAFAQAWTASADSLPARFEAFTKRFNRLDGGGVRRAAARPLFSPQAPQVRTAGAYMNIGFDGLADFGWSSNKDVGALQGGDHDPAVRGFTIPNVELTLDGAVDPYFKGFANIVYKLDAAGETGVELEEVYVLTTSLPHNLQIKGGQFFTEFGRQNSQHPHSWSFVDQPVVLNRMFGPDGLRSQGLRVSWLAPTPWYTEAMVGLMNSAGETAFSFRSEESSEIHGGAPADRQVLRFGDMLLVPRLATSFELTSTQTLVVGASAAFGPNNSGPSAKTRIYGADLYWKWKSATAHQGFPFVSLQAEVLSRRYDAASRASADDPGVTLPAEMLRDRGGYAQMLWGVKPRWVLGLRAELANGDPAAVTSALRAERRRVSPNVTWYPSEFSKLRLQYNYDHREGLGNDHSLWMQFEFILGAHASHKF
ncbi:MAG: hypothetical protein HOP28_08280 [Gemmatimonadales bacterium]|nr:hypothetical protein [Gemmatimonadales bacterium]